MCVHLKCCFYILHSLKYIRFLGSVLTSEKKDTKNNEPHVLNFGSNFLEVNIEHLNCISMPYRCN